MKNKHRNREYRIEFFLSLEEKELLEMRMKQAKKRNRSTFIRKCILENKIYIVEKKNLDTLAKEVSKVGVNINQAVKKLNSVGKLQDNDLLLKLNELNKLLTDFMEHQEIEIDDIEKAILKDKGANSWQ